jgi:hypothetical protein
MLLQAAGVICYLTFVALTIALVWAAEEFRRSP